MKEIIERLLDGKFNDDRGRLEFSTNKLELEIFAGEAKEFSLFIEGAADKNFYGSIGCSDARVECYTKEFTERKSELLFCFHGENLMPGEVVKGEIYAITNHGEVYVTFIATVVYRAIESSIGKIKNLFHFANLAKINWDEAVTIFYQPAFLEIFKGNDKQYEALYRGLSKHNGNHHNVDEFLIAIHKKQAVDYLIEDTEIVIDNLESDLAVKLEIIKDGWGDISLPVVAEDDFIRIEKERLKDEDFLGNICRFPIYIRRELLHEGNNFGKVRFYNGTTDIHVNFTIKVKDFERKKSARIRYKEKVLMVQLMEYYQAFRLKKISANTWQKESAKIVEEISLFLPANVNLQLYQAQLSIVTKRYNEAQWFIKGVERVWEESDPDNIVLYIYYLYLTTLIERDDSYTKKVADKVEKIYYNQNKNWKIAWFLLYLSETFSRNKGKKWEFLKEQYLKGCTSPFLYIEALQLLQQNPTLVVKFGKFEKSVLQYALRKDFLNTDIVEHITYLAEKQKSFDPQIYAILSGCYDCVPGKALLQAICSMLVKGNKFGQPYFRWYEKAVEQQLKITSLYEYYMLSVDLNREQPLPKTLLMYFSYQSKMDYVYKAYLYANLLKYKESNTELLRLYECQMIEFLQQQILSMHINKDLALLYKTYLSVEYLTNEMLENLSNLLYMHTLKLASSNQYKFNKIIVLYPFHEKEISYAFNEKHQIPLFGKEGVILFEDQFGNRYCCVDNYTKERILLSSKLGKEIEKKAITNLFLDAQLADSVFLKDTITEEMQQRLKRIIGNQNVRIEFRKKCQLYLLEQYYTMDAMEEMDQLLEQIKIESLENMEMANVVKWYVLRGMYDRAYDVILQYGFYHVELKILLKICSYYIEEKDDLKEHQITAIAHYIFDKGKYTENILYFLSQHCKGRVQSLRDVWKAALDFDVDCHKLSEKIIVQLLFANGFIAEQEKIFIAYIKSGAKLEIELAYLSQLAYDYFIFDKLVGKNMFYEMLRIYIQEKTLPEICKLAVIKAFADEIEGLEEANKLCVLEFVEEMIEQGKVFRALRKYNGFVDNVAIIMDKTILEHKAERRGSVVLHYIITGGNQERTEYCLEEMKQVFGNFYTKDFSLFFGENLQYYIMEEEQEEAHLTASGNLQNSDIMNLTYENKYSITNDIVTSYHLKDYGTVDTMLEEYSYKNFMSEHLFQLKE